MSQNYFPNRPILIIDDEEHALDSLEMSLYSHGIDHIVPCQDSRDALRLATQLRPSLVLMDLVMPYQSGDELLKQFRSDFPDTPVIMITGYNEAEKAVECIHCGAFDYMLKPVEADRLAKVIYRAMEMDELRLENIRLKRQLFKAHLESPEVFRKIITTSREMFNIFKYMEAVAQTSQCVLVTGETGTGKELIVQALHRLSNRTGACVTVNVAGLDDTMFADTLFGHEKGAFTGAETVRPGLIERAAGGTLFLDEIGDLAPGSQVKLLRLLQEHEYLPLGADTPRQSTARLVAATSKALETLKQEATFRKDFYYRLQTHHIHLPPLRQRPAEDLRLLTAHFLNTAAEQCGKPIPAVPENLFNLLTTYDFPGNIRELQAMIFDALTRHTTGELSLESLKNHITAAGTPRKKTRSTSEPDDEVVFPRKLPGLKECSRLLVREAMQRAGDNQSLAAKMLGVSTQALNQRLKRMK